MNFPFIKGRLRKAIERGLASEKLDEEIEELGDLRLKSAADAEAICWGLQQLQESDRKTIAKGTHDIVALFQQVTGSDNAACEILRERGTPELLKLYDKIEAGSAGKEDTDVLLFILKILAMYGTLQGTLKIVEAARQPLKPDNYMWSVILRGFTVRHPKKELLFSSLRDPLPPDFIGVSLLDAANAISREVEFFSHPFDSAEGVQRLQAWLVNPDPEDHSYAHSATAALPFLSESARGSLLPEAMKHPRHTVRMEAAWAAAKLGEPEGLTRLVEACLNANTAERAKEYLNELNREDLIPPQAMDPNFAALAEFSEWLAHPNELGEAPDELAIVDQRELKWPPECKAKPFWLIKYIARDTTGLDDDAEECGLVGSMTFCFFGYKLAQRPPEDAYAVHCYYEMEHQDLIEETDIRHEANEYLSLLGQWEGPALEKPQLAFVAEISPELKPQQHLVGLVSANLHGEEGWVVLDGKRSEWYPRHEQPAEVCESVVLKIHIGRQLLGFSGKPDRKKFISAPKPTRSPEQIIAAYQKILDSVRNLNSKQRKEAFRVYSPLAKHFEQYIASLIAMGRKLEARTVMEAPPPEWDNFPGWLRCGNAAYKTEQLDIAERFFLKCRNWSESFQRIEDMGLLADIWCRTGRREEAKLFLIECLRRLLESGRNKTDKSSKPLTEEQFQTHRAMFLKLFSPNGEAILSENGLPKSTLKT